MGTFRLDPAERRAIIGAGGGIAAACLGAGAGVLTVGMTLAMATVLGAVGIMVADQSAKRLAPRARG